MFESSVILYGNQTCTREACSLYPFESSVILYGNQTDADTDEYVQAFESSVILYGNQKTFPNWKGFCVLFYLFIFTFYSHHNERVHRR